MSSFYLRLHVTKKKKCTDKIFMLSRLLVLNLFRQTHTPFLEEKELSSFIVFNNHNGTLQRWWADVKVRDCLGFTLKLRRKDLTVYRQKHWTHFAVIPLPPLTKKKPTTIYIPYNISNFNVRQNKHSPMKKINQRK